MRMRPGSRALGERAFLTRRIAFRMEVGELGARRKGRARVVRVQGDIPRGPRPTRPAKLKPLHN